MPKVSVIVPVYNVERYIRQCLDSLLDQTVEDYEVVCIDDCSPDGCGAILEEYRERFENVIVVHNQQNKGLGLSRGVGVEASTGKYLMFVDSDDYVAGDYIETYLSEMERDPVEMLIGGFFRDAKGAITRHKMSDSVWSTLTYPVAWAKMFKRSVFFDRGLHYSATWGAEDIFFSLCAYSEGISYRVFDYEGYYYRKNRASITGSMNHDDNNEEIIARIYDEYFDAFDFCSLARDKQRVIEYVFMTNMLNSLISFGRGCGLKRMKEKREFVFSQLDQHFPEYLSNPHIGIFKPKGQTLPIRLAVGVCMGLRKIGLDGLIFSVLAIL